MRRIFFSAVILGAACAPVADGNAVPAPALSPYLTITPSETPAVTGAQVISPETPLPSATPSTYTIRVGDTLSQIAERLHVSVDSLLVANPDVNPNALTVGDSLLVPAGASTLPATPTPVPLQILEVACRPVLTGAAWCFALIHNDSESGLENITGSISIADSAGAAIATRDVALLLDRLPPGQSLPLAVTFPGPLPLEVTAQVRILTAMAVPDSTQRFLPAVVQNVGSEVSWSGRTADITGEVFIPAGLADASAVWVAAVAFDGDGRLVGWRRWESAAAMPAGIASPFEFSVYSLAGAIDRVEVSVQARP